MRWVRGGVVRRSCRVGFAAARGPGTLGGLAHEVGFGKTWTRFAAARGAGTLGGGRHQLRDIRVGTLEWAAGAFCALIGALMLIAPHQFEGPAFAALRPHLPWWGTVFLLAGAALLAVAALAPRRAIAAVVDVFGGTALLLLAQGFIVSGAWTGVATYTVLGLGLIAAALAPRNRPDPATAEVDLFVVVLGLSAVVSGSIILALPEQFRASIFDLVRPNLFWYGLAFLGGGLAVLLTQLRRSVPRAVLAAAHLLLVGAFFAYLLAVSLPNWIWTGIAYYGGFGVLLALLPWLGPRARRVDPTSLRTRLGLTLATVAAPPLIMAAALAAQYAQGLAATEALARQQTLATALAQSVGDYVALHRAALAALAAQPGLASLTPDAQRALLRSVKPAYPDVLVFITYDAEGNPVARSDDLALIPAAGYGMFENARRINVPSVETLTSPTTDRPILVFGAPIRASDGGFAGIVGAALETDRLATLLARASAVEGRDVYLVDRGGRIIAHSDASLSAAFADRSGTPPVGALLRRREAAGSLSYMASTGEQFAGYAQIPELGWGVVVERPAAAALATVRAARDVAFGVLLLVIGLAALAGWIAASRLAAPLGSLARAAQQLASGDPTAPLPNSRTTEVARLAHAFGEMRDRLKRRTAERERAERAQRFLAEAGTLLSASLDYETTLQSVARSAVPYLADLCVVDLVEEDGTIRRVAAAHADPAKQELATELLRYPPPADGTYNTPAVLRDGRSRLVPDIDEAYLASAARDPEHLRIIRELGPKSSMVVPLLVRDRTLGSIQLVATESRRAYGPADLALAEELAQRAAVAVENARLYREAQEAVRARDEFLSIASHELRTPVAGIKGHAQLLLRARQRGRLDPERLDRSIASVAAAADRLATLIHDLLDVSRIRLGQLPLRPQRLDLAALLGNVATRFREQLDERHRLVLDPVGPCPLWGDPDRLEQVLTNLLDNAVKYSPSGGDVRVSLRQDNGAAVLAVRDEGIGLPPGATDAIFQPFGRATNAARQNLPGMGLGLYICRDIVERHGGRIWAESGGEGRGTTMYVRLPREVAAEGEGPEQDDGRSSLTPSVPAADDTRRG